MYQIRHHKAAHILEIENKASAISAKIQLNEGASLQEYTFNNLLIIKNLEPLSYQNTYASAILFPFANRIKDGNYTFNGKTYQFPINQKEENNALHGLIFNKTFKISETEALVDTASVTLEYTEKGDSQGFPYPYHVSIKYTFTKTGLSLSFSAKNTSNEAFPFTVGWHPYFASENLYESTLQFDSSNKLIIGDRNIGTGIKANDTPEGFQIKDQQLDDCWVLNQDKVVFTTPQYKLQCSSNVEGNFLQAYTPPLENIIAIEPTTGVSNSFNNKIGLQVLDPGNTYNIAWNLKINHI
ncbi:aldose 1-epimerase [Tamlana agarivorans]|uniref:Aldose 1-epimerase n=1 Tax=Pseudotamlana agarivorans TaxID=481183 RepID=A0ACC5UCG2_9FLAO|nr:aldose 1-epimerase [Tamlana agarivorans]MBU2952016.1 aldose 1-epimerase [Tamlana agarivorans]